MDTGLTGAQLVALLEQKTTPEVVAMLDEREIWYYVRYHNDFMHSLQEQGYTTLADYARQHGYLHDQVMTLKNLLALLTLRYEKSQQRKHKHMRLRYLQDMFDTCVLRRDPLEWASKVERMEWFKKKNAVEKAARKLKAKAAKKIDEKFPLFGDQLKAEENARIEQEAKDKLKN
jgi:hypothetical protein